MNIISKVMSRNRMTNKQKIDEARHLIRKTEAESFISEEVKVGIEEMKKLISALTITSHIGDEYVFEDRPHKDEYYEVFRDPNPAPTSKKCDMKLCSGGAYQYIESDGTLVRGSETFPKEELKRAYDYFKNRAQRLRLEKVIQVRTMEILQEQHGTGWISQKTDEDVINAYNRAEDEMLGLDSACSELAGD